MNTEKNKFVGTKKIIWYNKVEDGIEFGLEDGSVDTVTEDQFEAVASESRYEDGQVRIRKWNKAVSEIVGVLLANRMKLIEKDFVTGRVDATIIENYQRAAAILFGAKYEEFINLTDVDRVLKENPMSEKQVEVIAEEVIAEDGAVEETVAPEVVEEVVAEVATSEESAE